MNWIVINIDWILIVCGVLTFSAVQLAVAPRYALRSVFGEETQGRLADLLARSQGGMVAASGLLLIYAAFHAEARLPILLFSAVGKINFIGLVIAKGYRGLMAMVTALADAIMVLLFALYLLAV